VRGGWEVLGGVLVATAGTQLRDSLDMNAQGLELLPDDALRHTPAQVLHQKPHTAVLREREGVETQNLTPSRDRSALAAALKPLAVDGTTISFSSFSWAVRPPGQDARNQAGKVRASRTPEMNMGVLFGRSSVGMQVFVTWAFGIVPSGLSLRGPDMSVDMRLLAVSDETTGSDRSEPMAVVWIDSLLYKLTLLNFPSYLFIKIPSYLQGQTFEASFQTATSSHRGMWAGVVQGELISPVLFSLYANDMPSPSHHVELPLYKDYTAITATSRKPTLLVRYLESYLDLRRWLGEWRIAINISKSTAIIFARAGRRFIQPRPVTLFGEPIQWVDTTRYLG